MAAGLIVMLLVVSGAFAFGDRLALLLSFAGVLAGASLIAVAHRPRSVLAGGGALAAAAFRRRNLAFVGLLMAWCAVTAAGAGVDAGPALCISMLTLLLLGISLVAIGIRRGP